MFGDRFGLSQSRVCELENGQPITPELALQLWDKYGRRLRGMGFSFERFIREHGTPRRERGGAEATP